MLWTIFSSTFSDLMLTDIFKFLQLEKYDTIFELKGLTN